MGSFSETFQTVEAPSTQKPLWWAIGVTTAFAFLGLGPTFRSLWHFWTDDPLQSIGMLLLPISVVLVLLQWRRLGWERHGNWWGLLLVALAYVLSAFHDSMSFYWSSSGGTVVYLFPVTLPLLLFGVGVVLLFAGPRLLLAAWFPLILLLVAKPVPLFFNANFDLPLQHATAHVARSFATAIGFAPKTPQLLLMFSPDFGMFIAPGCDGIRGASTMGYVALIVGYLKRLRVLPWIGFVVGAVLLGYLFNFLRICALVLYYRVALGHPYWENVAKQADYVIGVCLFTLAAMFFAWLILRAKGRPNVQPVLLLRLAGTSSVRAVFLRCGALLLLLFIACVGLLYVARQANAVVSIPAFDGERMPAAIGTYRLQSITYEEDAGFTKMEDGLYVSTTTNEQVTVTMWLGRNQHNVHDSWYARGETPLVRNTRDFNTATGRVAFDMGIYSRPDQDTMLLQAVCTPADCPAAHGPANGMILVFIPPDVTGLSQGRGRMVPVALKIVAPHTGLPEQEIVAMMTHEAERFLSGLNAMEMSRRFQ